MKTYDEYGVEDWAAAHEMEHVRVRDGKRERKAHARRARKEGTR